MKEFLIELLGFTILALLAGCIVLGFFVMGVGLMHLPDLFPNK